MNNTPNRSGGGGHGFSHYNRDGYDHDGYDRDGYDRDGYDRGGFDRDGFARDGFDGAGYDHHGYNLSGYNRRGHYYGNYRPSNGRVALSSRGDTQGRGDLQRQLETERATVESLRKSIASLQITADSGKKVEADLQRQLETERATVKSLRDSVSQVREETGRKRPRPSSAQEEASALSKFLTRIGTAAERLHVIESQHFDMLGIVVVLLLTLSEDAACRRLHQFMEEGPLDAWFCFDDVHNHGSKTSKVYPNERDQCDDHGYACTFVMVTIQGDKRRLRLRSLDDERPEGER
ncbi:hypothetical protein G7Z17_g7502 [Cylindrodendrum hubeiense]|uniref:Uncharacterized protein n=1 Tax=Cylindrodendrum hubeiense TaxID=595255 RepID=A0A9P5LE49_9HYPO|nr:hypothetical protein G7Z17_g7502 [Cylindrodendrum hubeiense]